MKPVFVTGVPRSGTSLVAGLLSGMGLWTGKTVGPSPDNPRGFFENQGLREGVLKPLLRKLHADPLGVKALPSWDECAKLHIRGVTKLSMVNEGWDDERWLFKDCKTTLTFPAWHRAFPDAQWVVVVRKPHDIVRSCLETGFMRQHSIDPQFWFDLIEEYMFRMRDIMAAADAREIWPQRIMEGDMSQLLGISEWLGLDYQVDPDFVLQTAWKGSKSGEEPFFSAVKMNVGKTKTLDNVRLALARDLPEVDEGAQRLYPVCIVAGGPSLKSKLSKLRQMQAKGAYVLALNGTHNYLLKRGIKPDGLVLLDARVDMNLQFVSDPQPGIRYYVASQCPPEIFDALRGYEVMVWHSSADGITPILKENLNGAASRMRVEGGCTVGLKSMSLMLMAGFSELHLFGFDSCLAEGEHHAYEQAQNDDDKLTQVRVGDRVFDCAVWMARQAQDWQAMCVMIEERGRALICAPQMPPRNVRKLAAPLNPVYMIIHGDGLLAHMAKTARKDKAA